MTTRHIAGFFLIPLVLLVAAGAINALSLWSFLGNLAVPWFCTALAIAVMVLGVTCLLLQRPPSTIPARRAALVVAAVLVILGVGFIVDAFAYARPADWLASAGEWVGFAVILAGVFWLPRLPNPPSDAKS
ncbi:MAG: hypothetical protein AAGA57_09180 [Planctomycetota bacterium]